MADTIVRLFDRPADALSAVRRIEALGIPHDDVSIVANNREGWYDDKGIHHDRLAGSRDGMKRDGMKDDYLDGKDDRVEGARGHAYALAAQHADRHGIAVGLEVAVELVRPADLERYGPDEEQERPVVERVGDRGAYGCKFGRSLRRKTFASCRWHGVDR